jgi:hypothetical protein
MSERMEEQRLEMEKQRLEAEKRRLEMEEQRLEMEALRKALGDQIMANNTVVINGNVSVVNNVTIVLPSVTGNLEKINVEEVAPYCVEDFKSYGGDFRDFLLKTVFFNPKYPQNHVIQTTDEEVTDIIVREDDRWKEADSPMAFDRIKGEAYQSIRKYNKFASPVALANYGSVVDHDPALLNAVTKEYENLCSTDLLSRVKLGNFGKSICLLAKELFNTPGNAERLKNSITIEK